tara:strand:+ start:226 stop:963 length:738 start_codon:yes stop_codon:yes gene_type:complete
MIKFLRKIRYDLMEKNKTGKYLKYAVGEIVLVVIGILIALQLNLYKENSKENKVMKSYCYQLLEDLNEDKKFLISYIEEMTFFKSKYKRYLESYKGKNLSLKESLKNLKQLDIDVKHIIFNSSTFQSLEKSGDIKILTDVIRSKLIDLKKKQQALLERTNNNGAAQGRLIEKLVLAIGPNDLSERVSSHPKMLSALGNEINQAKGFIARESIIAWKFYTERSEEFKELLLQIEELNSIINTELKK